MLQYLAKRFTNQTRQKEDNKHEKCTSHGKCKLITDKYINFHLFLKSIFSKRQESKLKQHNFQVQLFDSKTTDITFTDDELETINSSIDDQSLNSYLDDTLCSTSIEQEQKHSIDLKHENSSLEHLTIRTGKQSSQGRNESLKNTEQFGDVINFTPRLNNDSKRELSKISHHQSQGECVPKSDNQPNSKSENKKEIDSTDDSREKTVEQLNDNLFHEKTNKLQPTNFDRLDSPLSDFTDYYYHYNFYEQIAKEEQRKQNDLEVKTVQSSILSNNDALKQKTYYKSRGDLLLVRRNIQLQHNLVKKNNQTSPRASPKVFNKMSKNNLKQSEKQITFQEFSSTIIWILPIKQHSIILLQNQFLHSVLNHAPIKKKRLKQIKSQCSRVNVQLQSNKKAIDNKEYKIQLKTHEQHTLLAIDFNAFNNTECNPFEGQYRSLSHPDYSQTPSHWSDVYFDFNVGKENKLHLKIRNDIPLKYCSTVIAYQLGNPSVEKKIHFYWPNDTTELNVNQSLNEMKLGNNVEIITKFQL